MSLCHWDVNAGLFRERDLKICLDHNGSSRSAMVVEENYVLDLVFHVMSGPAFRNPTIMFID